MSGTTINYNDSTHAADGLGQNHNPQGMLTRFRTESERIQNLLISEILSYGDIEVRADAIMQLIVCLTSRTGAGHQCTRMPGHLSADQDLAFGAQPHSGAVRSVEECDWAGWLQAGGV